MRSILADRMSGREFNHRHRNIDSRVMRMRYLTYPQLAEFLKTFVVQLLWKAEIIMAIMCLHVSMRFLNHANLFF